MDTITLPVLSLMLSDMTLLIAYRRVNRQRNTTQAQSLARFHYTTTLIVIQVLAILVNSCIVLASLNEGWYFAAAIWTLIASTDVWILKKLLHDNNWFNRQFKKLKQRLKNLGRRLSNIRIAVPSPLPSPA